MVTIIDYGMGNLRSVAKAFEKIGARVLVTSSPAAVKRASRLVLPGVGAFADAVRNMRRLRIFDPVREQISRGTPFLGLCLGLQLLFEHSEEAPGVKGLGVFRGRVRRFRERVLKVPHMGWNSVSWTARTGAAGAIGEGIVNGTYFYFVHSYYADPVDGSIVLGRTRYGVEFPSVVGRDNIVACQFHPEKSQDGGLRLLKNFIRQ